MNDISEFGDKNINHATFKWNLTNVCNYECSYCNAIPVHGYHEKNFNNVDSEKKNSWSGVLKRLSLKNIGLYDIQILGGEPSIHPKFVHIIETLTNVKNCIEIEVYTNLSRSEKFYKDLSHDKLILVAAYHSEYYNEKFLVKIKNLHSSGVRIEPVINLSPHQEHWNEIIYLIDEFKAAGVKFRLNILHEVEEPVNYKPVYTEEFWDLFQPILLREWRSLAKITNGPIETQNTPEKSKTVGQQLRDLHIAGRNVTLKMKNGDEKIVDERYVTENDIMKFKNWKCQSMIYYINQEGVIFNECTKEILPVFFTDKHLKKYKTCPQSRCDRMSFIYYNKLHYHKKNDNTE